MFPVCFLVSFVCFNFMIVTESNFATQRRGLLHLVSSGCVTHQMQAGLARSWSLTALDCGPHLLHLGRYSWP